MEVFLSAFKQCWPPACSVIPRLKNNEALADLGLTPLQRRDIVLDLTASDYSQGPIPDSDVEGQDIWIFGTPYGNREIYIKLTVKKVEDGFLAKCLSFHLAEWKLEYPFR